MDLLCIRIYTGALRYLNPDITDAEIDYKLDTEFTSWFATYVSQINFILQFSIRYQQHTFTNNINSFFTNVIDSRSR